MGAASVQFSEIDLSTRVPSFPGVFGAISVASDRGIVGDYQLMTSETQYLNNYTYGDRINIGDDLAHYSALTFLQRSNKLWVCRVANSALHGGLLVPTVAGGGALSAFTTGIADPETVSFPAQVAFAIVSKDPGTPVSRISSYVEATPKVAANAFTVVVLFDGVEVERHIGCRVQGQKDGYNRSLYIEDVVRSSAYINVIDNIAELDTEQPQSYTVADAINLVGGSDGNAVTDGDRILASDKMKNTNAYPVTLLLDGGNTTVNWHKQLIGIAEGRKDCFALLSTPYTAENGATYLNDIIAYRKTTLNANTSYAALYTPHVKIYDKFNDRDLYVSPEAFVGAVISNTAAQFELWYPPAGFRRGKLPTAKDLRRRFTDGEMDLLYDEGINPLRFQAGKGITVWGQKTLLSSPSRLDRINVRMMLIVIEPAIAEALQDYVFEFNDVANRLLVTAMVESYMDNIRGRNGVADYYFMCNEENNTANDIDNSRMNAWLFVKPKGVAEFIKFKTIITPTGLDFGLAAQAI